MTPQRREPASGKQYTGRTCSGSCRIRLSAFCSTVEALSGHVCRKSPIAAVRHHPSLRSTNAQCGRMVYALDILGACAELPEHFLAWVLSHANCTASYRDECSTVHSHRQVNMSHSTQEQIRRAANVVTSSCRNQRGGHQAWGFDESIVTKPVNYFPRRDYEENRP